MRKIPTLRNSIHPEYSANWQAAAKMQKDLQEHALSLALRRLRLIAPCKMCDKLPEPNVFLFGRDNLTETEVTRATVEWTCKLCKALIHSISIDGKDL